MKSGPQGVSGKNVRVGKMFSTGGPQTVSALGKAEVGEMNNRLFSKESIVKGIVITIVTGILIAVASLLIEYNFFV